MARIASSRSPLKPLKWYKGLSQERGRVEAGAFMVEGPRAVAQVLERHAPDVLEIVAIEGQPVEHEGFATHYLAEARFRSISSVRNPQGPAAIVRLPAETYSARLPELAGRRVLVLEDVQDPGNVGTLIRTAVAFGFDGAVLSEQCADPFGPKCVQATAGTVLNLWLRRRGDYMRLVEELKSRGFGLVAADLDGWDDSSVLYCQDRLLLALGNEASGLSDDLISLADHRFRIPIDSDGTESLNVAASGAICMYLTSLTC